MERIESDSPSLKYIEFFVYAAAVAFALRRFDLTRSKPIGQKSMSPGKRTVTIASAPENILPHLKRELASQGFSYKLKPAPEGRGTEVTAFGDSDEMRKRLRTIKMIVETGEIATVSGQTHGLPKKISLTGRLGGAVHKLIHRRDLHNATEGQCKHFAGTESTN